MQRNRRRGVTLVEVLIVVSILALIAGAVAIFAIPQWRDAQLKAARTDTRTLVMAVDAWRLSHPDAEATCPTMETLKAQDVFKQEQNLKDPWGHPYVIACEGIHVGATSAGPDGQIGTADDISNGVPAKKS